MCVLCVCIIIIMGSMHWTDEESRYLKAIFTWQDRSNEEKAAARKAAAEAKKHAVGEFRILVIGAKGTGKTSILTKVGYLAFPPAYLPTCLSACLLACYTQSPT